MAETKRTLLERIDANVRALLAKQQKRQFTFRIGPVGTRTPTQGNPPMALILTDIQHVAVTLEADDAAGNAVAFDFPTPPTWSSSDPSIATVSPNADGSNADVATTGKLGDVQISVSGVDGAGDTITGLLDITVVTSRATTFKLVAGIPADK